MSPARRRGAGRGCGGRSPLQTSMYQLQLVHAFTQAVVDRASIYAEPLPAHLARQQAASLRERIGVPTDPRCPRHMLTTFTCLVCRKFRGSVIGAHVDEETANELPPFGTELVSFSSTSIQKRADELLRAGIMPSWQELCAQGAAHGSLFAWYKANAGIDMDMRPYPPDPR